jgi:hypothetical protein
VHIAVLQWSQDANGLRLDRLAVANLLGIERTCSPV